jgi:hypothetical protein
MHDYLRQWAIGLIRHMDAFERSITGVKEERDMLRITHKKKSQLALIQPVLQPDAIVDACKEDGLHISIFTLNTKANVDALLGGWQKLSKCPLLKIFFVNPYAEGDKKWVISPRTHSLVSDDDSLKLGISSLFQSVAEMSREDLRKLEKDTF